MEVHLSRDGQQIGSWPEEQLRVLYQAGQLLATDHYWYEGMPEWRPLGDLYSPPVSLPPRPGNLPPVPAISKRAETSQLAIIVPLVLAIVIAVSMGFTGDEPTAAGRIEYMMGGVLSAYGIAHLLSLCFPQSLRLGARCIAVVILFALAQSGKHLESAKAMAKLEDFTEKERQENAKELAQKGYIDASPQKTQATLDKIKELSQNQSGSAKKMTETVVELMEQIAAKREAIRAAEAPALALGFEPEKMTSLDALDQRQAALKTCQPLIADMLNFLQNVDGTLHANLAAKEIPPDSIDAFLKGFRRTGHVDSLISYWQLEGDMLSDYQADLSLLKDNWGKWHMDGGAIAFDDSQAADSYNANVKKLQDSAQQQQVIMKAIVAPPPPP